MTRPLLRCVLWQVAVGCGNTRPLRTNHAPAWGFTSSDVTSGCCRRSACHYFSRAWHTKNSPDRGRYHQRDAHFNKKNDVTNALLRVAESLAFGAIARHCFAVIDDLENERRLFVKAKNNVAPDNKALTFGINAVAVGQDEGGEPIWAPRVVWGLEHVDVTATQAMEAELAGKSAAGPRAEAKTFLLNMLVNGPVDKKEIEAAADANCISIPTLRRAKTELKIEAKKTGMNGGWRWHLPEQQPVSSRLDED